MTVDDVLTALTMLPVIGDFIQIGKSGARLMDRALNGEKEQCYRTGWELRGFKKDNDKCSSPGNLVKSKCLKPCPSGKSTAALLCLDKCYGKFPVECGIMCTANDDLCPSKVMATIDVVCAAVTVAKVAGDVASMNVVGFLSGGLKLIDEFAHPTCDGKPAKAED